ncbi:hypothetical protein [Archaeoglobus neptunius]|uniref:hypothetical protein n=1 Tax=Archaeoglobus neptunius TaxID=2798580 RepID=UPI001928B979|nr:hypothetical protein [Archaeoglobus neptunius]
MNEKTSKKDFDEKVNKVVKYGITFGLLTGLLIAILEHLTGAKGKIAEYSIVFLSISGFVIFVIFIVYTMVQLQSKR